MNIKLTAPTFAALALLGTAAPAQDFAKERLDKSPRHQEWVKIKAGDRTVQTFVVFPEVSKPATAVLVIHEIFGLSDWVKSAADQFAEAGYIALAPDLLSGMGPERGGTDSYKSRGEVNKAVSGLPPEQVTSDLNAVFAYARELKACNKKIAVAGFCWGGGQSFRYATNQADLAAALVFYGPAPNRTELGRVKAPVYGFYAENDARINQGIPTATEAMKELGKTYDPVTYDGAGHGFMRAGEDPAGSDANKRAREQAWSRLKELLKKL